MAFAIAPPVRPMLARLAHDLPADQGLVFEPKWDGFRCVLFFDGEELYLQSRDAKPLDRYFPELVAGIPGALGRPCVLDGEIVVMTPGGLDFDALQARIHPAASRVARLAAETPAAFVAFDCLAVGQRDLRADACTVRREALLDILPVSRPPVHVTPATTDPAIAREWFERFEGAGFDGVIAKAGDGPYREGARAWTKVKHLRTADCVVGGFRWNRGEEGRSVGSLLLGLHDHRGVLQFVGHTASFSAAERRSLVDLVGNLAAEPGDGGFGEGRTPGSPSRWSQGKDLAWNPLRPELVCEVTFDHLQGPRFRHAATFRRWRRDKTPAECTFDQFEAPVPLELRRVFDGS